MTDINTVHHTYEDDMIEYSIVIHYRVSGDQYAGGEHEEAHDWDVEIVAIDLQGVVSYQWDNKRGVPLNIRESDESIICKRLLEWLRNDSNVIELCAKDYDEQKEPANV